MMRRFSVFRSFQSTRASRGQHWLPLVALALGSLECNAAVDGEARVQISRQQTQLAQLHNQVRTLDTWRGAEFQTQSDQLQIRYDGLYHVQKDLNTLFVSLQEEHGKLPGEYTELHGNHQQLQNRFTLILAQAQTLSEEQKIAGQKLAQVESEGTNRGVVQLLNRVEGLNTDLNRLRGQIEVLTNDINNAQKRQRDMYVDLDTRLRRMEQQGAAARKDQEALPALEERIRKLEQAAAGLTTIPAPVPSAAAATVAAPPGGVATVSAPAVAPAATTGAAAQASLPPANLSAVDQAAIQRAYENAYSNYRINDYQGAIRGFDGFLKTFPKHQLAPNAQYWIGESYFHLHDYRAAIEAQRRLLGYYPDSVKVPDALLIIGTAETSLGDNAAARKTFEELIARYPSTESADKAKGRLAKLK